MTNAIPRRASQRRPQTRNPACGAGEPVSRGPTPPDSKAPERLVPILPASLSRGCLGTRDLCDIGGDRPRSSHTPDAQAWSQPGGEGGSAIARNSSPLAGSRVPVQSACGSGIATFSRSEAPRLQLAPAIVPQDSVAGDFLVMHLSSTNRCNGSRLKKASLPQIKNAIGFGSLPSREDM